MPELRIEPDAAGAIILERLAAIERAEAVRILYACESGSRAWGFASPDSDYDVRFIYVRPRDWYLSIDLEHRRDVIERPIEDVLDINGWDLRKALQLMRKSNPPCSSGCIPPSSTGPGRGSGRRCWRWRPPTTPRPAAPGTTCTWRAATIGNTCRAIRCGRRNTCTCCARCWRCAGWKAAGASCRCRSANWWRR